MDLKDVVQKRRAVNFFDTQNAGSQYAFQGDKGIQYPG